MKKSLLGYVVKLGVCCSMTGTAWAGGRNNRAISKPAAGYNRPTAAQLANFAFELRLDWRNTSLVPPVSQILPWMLDANFLKRLSRAPQMYGRTQKSDPTQADFRTMLKQAPPQKRVPQPRPGKWQAKQQAAPKKQMLHHGNPRESYAWRLSSSHSAPATQPSPKELKAFRMQQDAQRVAALKKFMLNEGAGKAKDARRRYFASEEGLVKLKEQAARWPEKRASHLQALRLAYEAQVGWERSKEEGATSFETEIARLNGLLKRLDAMIAKEFAVFLKRHVDRAARWNGRSSPELEPEEVCDGLDGGSANDGSSSETSSSDDEQEWPDEEWDGEEWVDENTDGVESEASSSYAESSSDAGTTSVQSGDIEMVLALEEWKLQEQLDAAYKPFLSGLDRLDGLGSKKDKNRGPANHVRRYARGKGEWPPPR